VRPRPDETSDWKGTYFIGRYRVVDEIGVGGMASVYLARVDGAGGFQKWVAIKRIHPHLTEKEHVVSMFLDEARIAASISHPNVAQVFDLGEHEGAYWIAMEYLHGEAVREIYRHCEQAGTSVDPRLVARIIADAAEGLHAAHDLRGKDGQPLNLVHRDVSPHNLFLTYDGVVKVVDFGIAKVSGRQIQTRVGVVRGKLAYMSPEQARCKPMDRRTDVFALGVVAWELLTGRRLFPGKNDLETVRNVLSAKIPSPAEVNPSVPQGLSSAVMRALERDPDKRYGSGRDFSRAMQQFLVTTGQLVGPQELGAFVSSLFGERVSMRAAHLKWAAEVTQTVSVDRLAPGRDHSGLPPSDPAVEPSVSVAMPLLRLSEQDAEWEQPTKRLRSDGQPVALPPAPPEESFDDELRTEVGPTWGVEQDRVVRSVAELPPARGKPSDRPVAAPVPSSIPPIGPIAVLERVPSFPLPAPAKASAPFAASPLRYAVAAGITFLLVALVSLSLVFAFRAQIRSRLGIPQLPSSSVAPATS